MANGKNGKNGAHRSGMTPIPSPARPKHHAGPGVKFKPGNPYRIKPGQVLNPGGKPKLLSEAYRQWLECVDEDGVSNAAKVAAAMGTNAAIGEVQAAKELRQATEGDKITYDVEQLTDEQLQRVARGEDIRIVLTTTRSSGDGAAQAQVTVTSGGEHPAGSTNTG